MTHQIIRLIVYAETKEEARERAEDILNNNLVGDGKAFDFGNFFDGEDAKARWGNLPPVVLANSKKGKKLIKDGMEATKKDFKESLKKVRDWINFYSDEELIEEKVIDIKKKILNSLDNQNNPDPFGIGMFKYYCYRLGQYNGTCVWLYDNDGQGIGNSENLKNVLEKWKCLYEDKKKPNPCKDEKVWCVICDVHS